MWIFDKGKKKEIRLFPDEEVERERVLDMLLHDDGWAACSFIPDSFSATKDRVNLEIRSAIAGLGEEAVKQQVRDVYAGRHGGILAESAQARGFHLDATPIFAEIPIEETKVLHELRGQFAKLFLIYPLTDPSDPLPEKAKDAYMAADKALEWATHVITKREYGITEGLEGPELFERFFPDFKGLNVPSYRRGAFDLVIKKGASIPWHEAIVRPDKIHIDSTFQIKVTQKQGSVRKKGANFSNLGKN
jgi:hypothetical protein